MSGGIEGLERELTNEQWVRFYNTLNSSDSRNLDELQKQKQILGLIKSILKARNEK